MHHQDLARQGCLLPGPEALQLRGETLLRVEEAALGLILLHEGEGASEADHSEVVGAVHHQRGLDLVEERRALVEETLATVEWTQATVGEILDLAEESLSARTQLLRLVCLHQDQGAPFRRHHLRRSVKIAVVRLQLQHSRELSALRMETALLQKFQLDPKPLALRQLDLPRLRR